MERETDSNNWRATARFVEGLKQLRTFQKVRDWEELNTAAKNFDKAITIDPGYKAARFYLGVSNELIGKHDEAANQFEQLLLETDQPDVDLLYNLGLTYFHQYHQAAYRRAVGYLNQVVELTRMPSSLEVATNQTANERGRRTAMRLLAQSILAQVYSHLSIPPKGILPEDAQEHFKTALQIATNSLKEFEQAKAKLDAQLAKDIAWGLHNAIAHSYLYAGRRAGNIEHLQNSISEFNKALKFDPDNYRIISNLGSAHLFLAKYLHGEHKRAELDQAERDFHRALHLKPNYDFAYARLAQIALQWGKLNEAKAFANLARENPSEMQSDYIEDLLREIDQGLTSPGFAQ
jgi:tetratricopeptide (TPR) repeat protein